MMTTPDTTVQLLWRHIANDHHSPTNHWHDFICHFPGKYWLASSSYDLIIYLFQKRTHRNGWPRGQMPFQSANHKCPSTDRTSHNKYDPNYFTHNLQHCNFIFSTEKIIDRLKGPKCTVSLLDCSKLLTELPLTESEFNQPQTRQLWKRQVLSATADNYLQRLLGGQRKGP